MENLYIENTETKSDYSVEKFQLGILATRLEALRGESQDIDAITEDLV